MKIRLVCFALAGVGVTALGLLCFYLVSGTVPVLQSEGLGLFTRSNWYFLKSSFGAASMIFGTLSVSAVALLVALPTRIGSAIALSEFVPLHFRFPLKALVELLAGIPSVIYGLLGIAIVRVFIQEHFSDWGAATGDNLFTAGLLLGVMILPTIVTQSDDALQRVSKSQRLQSRALGLDQSETTLFTVLPQAMPGILSGVLLAFGRAFGETIAVFLVVGRADNQIFSGKGLAFLLEPGQTLTSKLGGAELNIAYGDTLHWSALLGLALILLIGSTLSSTLARKLISLTSENKT